jgi:CRP-like cAMP-binding protein
VIFSQGSVPRAVFLVERGVAKLVFLEPNGSEIFVALRRPGQFVDYGPPDAAHAYPLSAIALVTSEIYKIDIAAVQCAHRRNPALHAEDADGLHRDLENLAASFVRSKLLSPADRLERLLRDLAMVLGGGRDSIGRTRVVLPLDNFRDGFAMWHFRKPLQGRPARAGKNRAR